MNKRKQRVKKILKSFINVRGDGTDIVRSLWLPPYYSETLNWRGLPSPFRPASTTRRKIHTDTHIYIYIYRYTNKSLYKSSCCFVDNLERGTTTDTFFFMLAPFIFNCILSCYYYYTAKTSLFRTDLSALENDLLIQSDSVASNN